MHYLSLTDTWVPRGRGTLQHMLPSLRLTHMNLRHLRRQVWTLWRVCWQQTHSHKPLCYLRHSYHVRKLFVDFKETFPWHPVCCLFHHVTLFALLSLSSRASHFYLPSPSFLKKSLTTGNHFDKKGEEFLPFLFPPPVSPLGFGSVK